MTSTSSSSSHPRAARSGTTGYRPGLNHLAFHVSDRGTVDRMVGEALLHGWRLLFADRHPYAGGEQHYAAYLEDRDGYEVELVAPPPRHGTGVAEGAHRADRRRGPPRDPEGPSALDQSNGLRRPAPADRPGRPLDAGG